MRADERREQHAHVKPRRRFEVRQQRAAPGDARAGLSRPPAERPSAAATGASVGPSGCCVSTSTRAPASVVARRRQRETVADAVLELVRSGDRVEQRDEIVGGAGHRADHREIDRTRQGRQEGRRMAARRHEIVGRLVREDAAEMGRRAQRAADVGAQRQRAEAGGERGRGAARRAAGVRLRSYGLLVTP